MPTRRVARPLHREAQRRHRVDAYDYRNLIAVLNAHELLQLSLPGENLGAIALAEVVSRDTDLPDTVGQGDQ